MIGEAERYHGIVLSRIIRHEDSAIIQKYGKLSGSGYIVNGVCLYIKYSTRRMSPWQFTFLENHQDEIMRMKSSHENVIIALVCGNDGIASLNYSELKEVLDEEHGHAEVVMVHRPPRGKYKINGTDGKMKKTVADNEFPKKMFTLSLFDHLADTNIIPKNLR